MAVVLPASGANSVQLGSRLTNPQLVEESTAKKRRGMENIQWIDDVRKGWMIWLDNIQWICTGRRKEVLATE